MDGPVGRSDEGYERFARLARRMLDAPVSLVSFVDEAGQVFPGAVGLPEPWQSRRGTGLAHSFCQYVVRSDEPLVVTDARQVDFLADNLAIPDLHAIAYAGFPLHDGTGAAVGSLCAIDDRPRRWTDDELSALSDLAQACSAEVTLRSQQERARRAQHDARLAARHARLLLLMAEELADTTTVDEVLDAVQRLARTVLGVDRSAVAMIEAHRLHWVRHDEVAGVQDSAWAPVSMSDRRWPSVVVAASRQALFFEDGDVLAEQFPVLAGAGGAGAMALLPIATQHRQIGVLLLRWQLARAFTDDLLPVKQALASYAALALERAQLLDHRREVAHVLQEAMLTELPRIDGLELSSSYVPAEAGERVGGDWYDVLDLGDRGVAISMGDVTGHDLRAASLMGQLRSLWRAFAWVFARPPSAIAQLVDQANTGARVGATASMIVAHLDPPDPSGARRLQWSNAGHLPPLVRRADGDAELLEARGDLLVGFAPDTERHDHEVTLRPGDALVLFTDGLVERRTGNLRDALSRLPRRADDVAGFDASSLVATLTADSERHDDVAVLVVRLLPVDGSLPPAPARDRAEPPTG
ncbi:GAF domain-containing SpoIIE family protein phosphatase [Cellulomonas edaphi]|uniref:SpoIIE family protein phosphatase n=1 Tax=Cellulomonas edaphi TaxID=3053468 RepID=A0ABT7S5U6_9CELL|nr:GAF domain-containing SpoIIE family protein phosphatase [Cellulomons edaphi]MDM7830988.1 SpoIIE family protein phosphatase [Cellulomons edaphi]